MIKVSRNRGALRVVFTGEDATTIAALGGRFRVGISWGGLHNPDILPSLSIYPDREGYKLQSIEGRPPYLAVCFPSDVLTAIPADLFWGPVEARNSTGERRDGSIWVELPRDLPPPRTVNRSPRRASPETPVEGSFPKFDPAALRAARTVLNEAKAALGEQMELKVGADGTLSVSIYLEV